MDTDGEMIAVEVLMVVSFVPVAVWLICTAVDYAWQRWGKKWVGFPYRKNRILHSVATYSRCTSVRENDRVLR